jgi:hypothetical protein
MFFSPDLWQSSWKIWLVVYRKRWVFVLQYFARTLRCQSSFKALRFSWLVFQPEKCAQKKMGMKKKTLVYP